MNGDKVCCKNPRHLQHLTEVSLLILLRQGICHGYAMLEHLNRLDLCAESFNASTLYRNLRKMEQDGIVRSSWEAGGPGPNRRVYQLTEQGVSYLGQWIELLEARQARISKIIAAYRCSGFPVEPKHQPDT
ncbi:MAG: PadR family transcriptional regulator [Clostridiaceae bacterium]|jgi:DNA-binding PadR family transcriptional regulator|nr:PadR family transcriptional regulator [Clostridiaceae bacterium]